MHRPVEDMFHSTSSSRDSGYDPAFNGGRQDLATALTEIFVEGLAQLDPHKKRALINMVEGSNHASGGSAEQLLEQADPREGKGSEQLMGEGKPSKRVKEEYCSPEEVEPRLAKTSLTLDEGKYNRIVGMRGETLVDYPVDEALEMTKSLDPVLLDVCNTISI